MKIAKLLEMNETHIDVLREIGNIGAGNAATSLASMTNITVDMAVPKVKIINIEQAGTMLGGPENIMVGILTKFNGDIEGIMMYILEKDFAVGVIRQLIGVDVNLDEKLEEIELSVISEIGNILSASYINAIASLTGLNINISVPAVAIDMVGALLSVPAMEMSIVSDEIIFVEGVLINSNKEVTSNILLVPSMESLNIMLSRLGIDL